MDALPWGRDPFDCVMFLCENLPDTASIATECAGTAADWIQVAGVGAEARVAQGCLQQLLATWALGRLWEKVMRPPHGLVGTIVCRSHLGHAEASTRWPGRGVRKRHSGRRSHPHQGRPKSAAGLEALAAKDICLRGHAAAPPSGTRTVPTRPNLVNVFDRRLQR